MIGFNALTMGILSLLAIPLIIFYFLKLKRPHMPIPSLFLWQQVISDSRVNSPFQRFKRHILLFLQLLILLLLVLAAMQPFYMGQQSDRNRIPILIDNSVSMGALDRPGGQSRLEAAKDKVRNMIDNKVSGQEFCIISFSSTARKRCSFTDNARVLLDALDRIEIEDVSSQIEDALRMTQALSKNYSFDEVLLFSDGNFPEKVGFDLPYKLNYQKLPPAGPNLGITQLSARRAGKSSWNVFAQLSATAGASAATVQLYQDGKLLNTESFTPVEGRDERILFQVDGSVPHSLEVRLLPEGEDSLAQDNSAFIDLPIMRPLAVSVAPELESARLAMSGIANIDLIDKDGDIADADLVVDVKSHTLNGNGIVVTMGTVPEDLKPYLEIKDGACEPIDWDHSEHLLQHVELSGLTVVQEPCYKQQAREADLERLGYEVIIHGKKGPLALRRNWGGRLSYHFLFHPDQSTFPYRIGYPIMMTNLVKESMFHSGLADTIANRTGVLPAVRLTPGTTYDVVTPKGETIEETTGKNGVLGGIPALTAGWYEIKEGSDKKLAIGVSPLSPSETSLAGVEKIQFNELAVSADKETVRTARSMWQWLSLFGLLVVLVEWWFYHRRPVLGTR